MLFPNIYMLNPLKIGFNLNFMQILSSYRAANTLRPNYKNQLANPVQGINLTLLWGLPRAH